MKKFLSLLLALGMVASLAACGGSSSGNDSSNDGADSSTTSGGGTLTFTTGGESGTYYAFGGVIAQDVSANTGTTVTAISSGGSKANVLLLQSGDAQLGFCQSDVMAYAYDGTRTFEDAGAYKDFSTVANLYMEQVQIVTCNPDIKTVADLKGKKVSIGDAGSGVYFNAVDVLTAYGLDVEKDIIPNYQGFGDSADSLKDGTIDAAFIVAGAPTTAITSLATTKDVYLVSLDDEHIDKLLAESPYYSKTVIPEGTYEGTPEATTVAVGAVVIARDDVSEDDIYNFVSDIYENAGSLSHGKAAELDLEFAASVTAVPYHAGAAKYFAEKGITVPTK